IHALGNALPVVCTPDGDSVITTVEVEEEEVDEVAPEITLNGDNPMELEVGETYQEPGATAEDGVDGDISDNIEISGEVDTEEPGEYEITYTVVNEAGNEVTVTRTVIVNEVEEEPGDGEDNGEDGEDGNDGEDGEDGNDGEDGEDGNNGEDGEDGNDGEDGEDGNDGEDGEDGNDGADGEDGHV